MVRSSTAVAPGGSSPTSSAMASKEPAYASRPPRITQMKSALSTV